MIVMASKWEQTARYVRETFGTQVDWYERFFICPECGEPIYECDWADHDFATCPVCDFDWYEGE